MMSKPKRLPSAIACRTATGPKASGRAFRMDYLYHQPMLGHKIVDEHEPHEVLYGMIHRNKPAALTSKRPMDTLLQDLRYAVRTLVNNPGFAALTVLCLALGIGVNSTIFSVVDTVAIRPLPFTDPNRLVSLNTTNATRGINSGGVSYPDFRDWKERAHSFADIAAVSGP